MARKECFPNDFKGLIDADVVCSVTDHLQVPETFPGSGQVQLNIWRLQGTIPTCRSLRRGGFRSFRVEANEFPSTVGPVARASVQLRLRDAKNFDMGMH